VSFELTTSWFKKHHAPTQWVEETNRNKGKQKITYTMEVGSTFFGCWSVEKYEKLLAGPYSVQNF
jgi:hypothetical protein